MKSLYLSFDEKEFSRIKKLKDLSGLSWEKFILKKIMGESILDNTGKPGGKYYGI